MKKTIFTYGLISGAIVSLMLSLTCMTDSIQFDQGMIIGYTSMVLAMSLIYFGVRSYRDKYLAGSISFGKAFRVGISIALISSLCYVLVWMVINTWFYPEFMDNYTVYYLQKLKDSGISEEAYQKEFQEMEKYKEMYRNPLLKIGFTFAEIFPVGLFASLVCAFLVKKNNKSPQPGIVN